ncbi:hypothetical protein Q8F55_005088 [Vanrija albida]|uniref:Uncharacterized protein n=1 Tax=Vanrija albida TaxID=181172 RepID=A0ABR3Q0Z5_9TREE
MTTRGPNFAKNQAKRDRRKARKAAALAQAETSTLSPIPSEPLGAAALDPYAAGKARKTSLEERVPRLGESSARAHRRLDELRAKIEAMRAGDDERVAALAESFEQSHRRLDELRAEFEAMRDGDDVSAASGRLRIALAGAVRRTLPGLMAAVVRAVCAHVYGADEATNSEARVHFEAIATSAGAGAYRRFLAPRSGEARAAAQPWALRSVLDAAGGAAPAQPDTPALLGELLAIDAVTAPRGGPDADRPALLAVRLLLEAIEFRGGAEGVLAQAAAMPLFQPTPEQASWLKYNYHALV